MALRPIIGGYKLFLGLEGSIHSCSAGVRHASSIGGRVTARPSEREPQVLVFAPLEREAASHRR